VAVIHGGEAPRESVNAGSRFRGPLPTMWGTSSYPSLVIRAAAPIPSSSHGAAVSLRVRDAGPSSGPASQARVALNES
jgi:hypothetical protein